ncbi:hypothetical protein MBLNU459_g1050t2 [Dothideomycetes sp. NU459]
MSSKVTTVYSRGIYHGLPEYPADVKNLRAIVTGANGISGYHMVKVLSQAPERWSKIYCLSRRPPAIPGGLPKNAEFVSVDFLQSPGEIAEKLRTNGIKADYVFFFSYVQPSPKEGGGIWSDVDELVRVNKLLLSNFLEALPIANVVPKRIMLQTGAKNYGVHLGPPKQPSRETDPRVTLEPNFYYAQEDILDTFAAKHGVQYSIAMPCGVLGAVPDAAMNECYPLAVYASVQKHLGRPLTFPGGLAAWENCIDQSSATLNAYLEEWTVLRDQSNRGEKFNATDGSAFTWGGFWPRLAAWYGLEYEGPSEDGLQTQTTPYDPPPRGFGPPAKIGAKFLFAEWAKDESVQEAWRELAKTHGLEPKEIRDTDRIFGFLDGMLLMTFPLYFR